MAKLPNLKKVAFNYFERHSDLNPEIIYAFCEEQGLFPADAKARVVEFVNLMVAQTARRGEIDEVRIFQIPKETVQIDDSPEFISEQYVYTSKRIILESFMRSRATDEHESSTITKTSEVLLGSFSIIAKINFGDLGDQNIPRWQIRFKNEDFSGTLDEIANYLYVNGNVVCRKEDIKRVLAAIISNTEGTLPTHTVYPAIGFYYDKEKLTGILALDANNVKPLLDSQKFFFERFKMSFNGLEMERSKEVLQASVDFIESMPEINKFSALLARGYACIAPLAYIIKGQTAIKVFPFLYLYGSKGSSKTHIASVSLTYTFGELEVLSSDAIKSEFRLGQEYGATTFPRVVDEAHDVFAKLISMFKSGSTSTMATKRGNQKQEQTRYNAFCSFCFTSNVAPIASEQDVQGAMMDRVLVVPCERGDDFNKKKYLRAMDVLLSQSPVIGQRIIELLEEKLKDGGLKRIEQEIIRIADIFMELDDNIQQRRAFCLAILAYGTKLYLELCQREGLLMIVSPTIYDDKWLCEMIIDKIQKDVEMDERENLQKFMGFLNALDILPIQEMTRAGVHRAAGYGEGVLGGGQSKPLIVSANTLDQQKKFYGLQTKTFSKLGEVVRELGAIGIAARTGNHRCVDGTTTWGVCIDLEEFARKSATFSENH